ncbi:CBS domain-containing protein [Geotoga petraea]|jgi:tRNA nucleotidyltransferase (CCA-adding enzyme)|uniref:tRNA nucleotidyltransferase (CCA-adding enzyme) n=1 Tax=Geotoga petraea TaxID=28234 RepID=A0A1G6PAR6_9BACT|nr:CBS domain-containing protein [Geotoga petraea]SDC77233.1 tRNA nucleotidyltransferase (CCA-adding enzyme) [Geotoga petraea]
MKTVITTHNNPDFDGFAAAFAASLIYENPIIVIKGQPAKNLNEFLHIYELEFYYENEFLEEFKEDIDNEGFSKVVIVDTADINRIPKSIKKLIENGIEVDIYDHHPKLRDRNIKGNDYSKEMGAAVTIVLQKVFEKKIDLPDTYETLFLIAIHEDTGNFVYTTTEIDDHLVAAELIKNGARLEEVEEFVSLEMTEEQKELFDKLYNNIHDFYVNDLNVFISYWEIEKFIGGLNVITHKIFEALMPDILFVVVRMGKNAYIVGRSRTDEIDLNTILSVFGGGGHKKAGAAKAKEIPVQTIIDKIISKLKESFIPVIKASNIMSSPVRTILSEQKIEKAYEIMEQTGHSSLPVVDKNKLVGLITKKDVEKARKHKLSHAPVKSVMTNNLKVVDTDTSVSHIRKIMAENDIGRLPVLKDGILMGIITRSDILRASNGVLDFSPNPIIKEKYDTFNVSKKMQKQLPKRIMNLLRLLGAYGSERKTPVYVVGGFVRDLLLNVENLDIDIVVEGDGPEFGKFVAEQLMIKYVVHEKFNTCSLFFKDGFRIDVATARTEYYESPAELPKVEVSTIKKDLYRRDFSINAMAIKLNQETFGTLLDFFNSKKDLEEGIIKVLYSLSFVEDPTRILRAIRFEQRYNFQIDEQTCEYMKKTVKNEYLEKVTGPRIRDELEKILKEPKPLKSIRRMGEFKIISHLFPFSYYTPTLDKDVEKLFELYGYFEKNYKQYTQNVRFLHLLLFVLLQYTPEETVKFIEYRYGLPGNFYDNLAEARESFEKLNELKHPQYSHFFDCIKILNSEQIIFVAVKLKENLREKLFKYFDKIENLELSVNGKELKDKGYYGKEIKNKLEELTKKLLNDEIKPGEERKYI